MNNVPETVAMLEGETGKKAEVQYGAIVYSDGRVDHVAWVTTEDGDPVDNDETEEDE